jgi:LacI family transcriptional regulator
MRDVAERAGVSAASVSRVLNNPSSVSPDLRRRIEDILKDMAYVPHWAGRALASRRSRTIGAVVPTLDIAVFAAGIEAMQTRLHQFGHSLLVASSAYDQAKEVQLVRTLIERGVDGMALVGSDHAPEVYRMLGTARVPVVNTYVYDTAARYACVGLDNRQASHKLIRYLLELGHRHFGLATSPARLSDRTRARLEGMIACLADHGIDLPARQIVEVPYSVMDGRSALHTLLSTAPQITAVACTSDVLAIGVVLEAVRQGVRLPDELSVTGFDDLELSAQIDPQLTTVHVPARLIGQRAADFLVGAIIDDDSGGASIELPTSLILRGSTGRVPDRQPGAASRRLVASVPWR